MLSGEKIYPLDVNSLLASVRELAALQNWDESPGRGDGEAVVYISVLYGLRHKYRFTLSEAETGTSVRIETDAPGAKGEIQRQFLLIEKIIDSEGVVN